MASPLSGVYPGDRWPAELTPPGDDALAAGLAVAHAWAEQDKLDPARPTLAQLVATEVDRRVAGRRATDGAHDALLDRIAATLDQRQRLADLRERTADLLRAEQPERAAEHQRWADTLRGQYDAIRSVLTVDEATAVGERIERLRRAEHETRPAG
jgi:hypothetical protein